MKTHTWQSKIPLPQTLTSTFSTRILIIKSRFVPTNFKALPAIPYAGNIWRGKILANLANCRDSPNFYPPNVLVLPSKQLAKVSSSIFYHPKVKEMCMRQYFTPSKYFPRTVTFSVLTSLDLCFNHFYWKVYNCPDRAARHIEHNST